MTWTKRRFRVFLLACSVIFLASIIAVMNAKVSIRQGVDGECRTIEMPLYVKWVQFLARHYEYERLARGITKGSRTEEENALAILEWTKTHIRNTPKGFPVFDDHILNIIIRGYGVPEQFQDVFTLLCAYAGMPAFWDKVRDNNKKTRYTLSFVKIGGRWRVFDAYYGIYFRNRDDEIASVEDIIKDPSIIEGARLNRILAERPAYQEYYYNLKQVSKPDKTNRAEKQMPAKRILFEVRKALRIEHENVKNQR